MADLKAGMSGARVRAHVAAATQQAAAGDVDGAVAFLLGKLEGARPTAYFCRRVVWFLHGQKRVFEAAALLERLEAGLPEGDPLHEELTILALEHRLAAVDAAGLEAQLDAGAARFPDSDALRAVSVVGLCLRGRTDQARALLWAAPVLGRKAVARALRFHARLDVADRLMLAEYVVATGWTPELLRETPRMAGVLMDRGRAADALQMVQAAIAAADGGASPKPELMPKLELMAARAAWLCGAREDAGAALARVVGAAHPGLSKIALKTMTIMLKDSVPTERLQLSFAQVDDQIDTDREPGYMQRWIDAYRQQAPVTPFSYQPLRRFVTGCVETDQIPLLHQELQRIPADATLGPVDLQRLLRVPGLTDNPATCAVLHRHLIRGLDPCSARGIQARLMLLPPGPEFQVAAADCLEHLESGHRAWDLRFFLAEEWPVLQHRIDDPRLAAGLARQAASAFDTASERSNLDMIAAQRHLHETILNGLPDPRPAKVSILAPCHRAADLENLRRCVAWQTWPDIELIVVANGPLLHDPVVERTLRGLPGLKILQAAEGRIGRFLNMAIDAATGSYLMRFDSDDLYFENYIANALRMMQAANADIAGKSSLFVYSERLDRVLHAPLQGGPAIGTLPYRFHSGSSLMFTRQVAGTLRFQEDCTMSEDRFFYLAAQERGLRRLTLDPFDHLVVRKADKGEHTWQMSETQLLNVGLMSLGTAAVIPALCCTPARPA